MDQQPRSHWTEGRPAWEIAGMASLSRRPFVGRDREIEELASGLDDAGRGRGGLFLVVGPAGMGKTRLCDEASRAATTRGARALWGRCWETGGAPAYWPWIQVLRELTRGADGAALVASLGGEASPLAQLLPEAFGEGSPAPAAEADPAAGRFRLFQAVVALIRAAGERGPLLLILDDLHAADPSSLTLLHFVARNLRGLRVVILGGYRDEEARVSESVGPLLVDIAREGTYLPLPALTRAEIAALVTATAGPAAGEPLIDAVERASEGNPLFLSELLRLMLQRGDFARASAGDPQALPIPDTIREVIARRVARLSPETRDILETASVAGRDFGAALVAAIAARPVAAIDARLSDAERGGLIASSGVQSWRFSHVLVREALYREMEAQRRASLHLQVAVLLETGAGHGQAVAEIAHHRLAALPSGDPVAAAFAARIAAEQAMGMLAFEDAAVLFERAEQTLSAAGGDRPAICQLKLGAALAHMRTGAVERGRATCVDAAADARRLGDGALLARAALTYGAELMLAQTDQRLVNLLNEALAALPPGPSGLRAQCMGRLGAALQPAYDPTHALAMARASIVMARATDDDEVLRGVLSHAGSALADYAEPSERAPLSEELSRLATAAGDRVSALRAQSRLVFDYAEMGRLDRSARAVDAYQALARDLRQPRHIWPERLMRAMLALAAGRLDEADQFHAEAVERARADHQPVSILTLAMHSLGRALASDRPDDLMRAEEDMERGERELTELFKHHALGHSPDDMWRIVEATLQARAGDVAAVKRCLSLVPRDSHFLLNDIPTLALLAEPVALSQDADLAALLYDRMLPYAARVGNLGRTGMVCMGALDGPLGVFASVLGRTDDARAHLEKAIARDQAAGLVVAISHARHWHQRLFGSAAAPALPASSAGVAVPTLAASLPRAAPFTLVREGEYWTVRCDGQVCRLKESRGLEMLAELVNHPHREFHVLALMGAEAGAAGEVADGGDAGALLDREAIADYRARIAELDDDLAEAESWGDSGRLARARDEREALAREIARGVGLGGRERRAGAPAERARTNVQRRLRGAIRKIAETIPGLGAYLERTVRTGTFCCYEPLP